MTNQVQPLKDKLESKGNTLTNHQNRLAGFFLKKAVLFKYIIIKPTPLEQFTFMSFQKQLLTKQKQTITTSPLHALQKLNVGMLNRSNTLIGHECL